MARRFWPQTNPVGKRVRFDDRWSVVVGIVGDVRHESLTSTFFPTVYVPVSGVTTSLVVRTGLDPEQLFPQIREAVRSVDPGAPILRTATVSSLITETASQERFRTVLLLAFAVLAVLLGAAGVFGVTARVVSRRTKELGIRLALGAHGRELTRTTVRRSLSSGLLGIAVGLPIAYGTSFLLSPFLFGVNRWDPMSYGAATALMVGVCWLASYVPARKIALLDPVKVLKHE
jgi:ABC-type antimicrobial peptide transport system permease subunit